MDVMEKSLALHYERRGKIEIAARVPADSSEALSLAYTPGVAKPCLEIQKDINKSYELTRRWNTVAVVTDGTAVLGLGDIGPEAGMPVMEGGDVITLLWQSYLEFGTWLRECIFVFLLEGEGCESTRLNKGEQSAQDILYINFEDERLSSLKAEEPTEFLLNHNVKAAANANSRYT